MKEHEIRQLIKIVEESDINELEISRWGKKIRITKNRHSTNGSISTFTGQPSAEQRLPVPEAPLPTEGKETEEEEPAGNLVEVKSPMVGTFYGAPAPDADPYVMEKDSVKIGDVLCIVEAMKLMNEIESEYSGRIEKILVENAKPVQYNQPLFLIDVG